ncbi:MAG TPA: GNAT family N-acetyltransferase, partial [Acidimicrobiales bacterium]|nr:GNAT family N-acetyltransferase [Acidimicrobiales bacterium]
GQVVGTAALIPLEDAPGEYEMGWHLAKAYWGQGYAFESGVGLLRYAFEEVELDEVLALAHPENERSMRACRRLGMVERAPRMNQGYEHACFGATRPDWSPPSG